MLPRESRNSRGQRRARRQTDVSALESLEKRTLLSFSTLGYSLPDLTITGETGPRAAWGGTIDVSVYLDNIGASSTTEPMSQLPPTEQQAAGSLYGSTSASDAPDSMIEVVLTKSPHSLKGAVTLGTFEAPPLNQNSVEQVTDAFTLPARPKGFPAASGKFYVWFFANSTGSFQEVTRTNNLSKPVAVQLTGQALPELRVVGLSVPSRMQAGDTINPTISIENLGTADSGPVTVDLVESLTKSFTVGSSIIASYTVTNVPAASKAPTGGNFRTVNQRKPHGPAKHRDHYGGVITLSTTPKHYYLGVVVDPTGAIKQLSLPANALQAIHDVGPPIRHLPPAGVISNANTEQFPSPASGVPVGFAAAAPLPTPTPTPTPTPPDPHADADTDSHPDTDSHTDSDADSNAHADAHAHADPDAHGDGRPWWIDAITDAGTARGVGL